MIDRTETQLIDRDELIEQVWRSDVSTRDKIVDLICRQPVVAVAVPHYEVKVYQ